MNTNTVEYSYYSKTAVDCTAQLHLVPSVVLHTVPDIIASQRPIASCSCIQSALLGLHPLSLILSNRLRCTLILGEILRWIHFESE